MDWWVSSSDGSASNRKEARFIISELQQFKDLLIIINVCVAHTMSCSVQWGLGNFEFGNILRTAHTLQAVKRKNFESHTDKFLRYEVPEDSLLLSETALNYFNSVGRPGSLTRDDSVIPDTEPPKVPNDERASMSKMWKKFARLIHGQKGPYTKQGVGGVPDF